MQFLKLSNSSLLLVLLISGLSANFALNAEYTEFKIVNTDTGCSSSSSDVKLKECSPVCQSHLFIEINPNNTAESIPNNSFTLNSYNSTNSACNATLSISTKFNFTCLAEEDEVTISTFKIICVSTTVASSESSSNSSQSNSESGSNSKSESGSDSDSQASTTGKPSSTTGIPSSTTGTPSSTTGTPSSSTTGTRGPLPTNPPKEQEKPSSSSKLFLNLTLIVVLSIFITLSL